MVNFISPRCCFILFHREIFFPLIFLFYVTFNVSCDGFQFFWSCQDSGLILVHLSLAPLVVERDPYFSWSNILRIFFALCFNWTYCQFSRIFNIPLIGKGAMIALEKWNIAWKTIPVNDGEIPIIMKRLGKRVVWCRKILKLIGRGLGYEERGMEGFECEPDHEQNVITICK